MQLTKMVQMCTAQARWQYNRFPGCYGLLAGHDEQDGGGECAGGCGGDDAAGAAQPR